MTETAPKAAWRYLGGYDPDTNEPLQFIPGVPARDLTDEEFNELTNPVYQYDDKGNVVRDDSGERVVLRDALMSQDNALFERIVEAPPASDATKASKTKGGDD